MLQSCFYNIKFIFILYDFDHYKANELLASSMKDQFSLACNTYFSYVIGQLLVSVSYTSTNGVIHTYTTLFDCVNGHNTRNLYHIRVVDPITTNDVCARVCIGENIQSLNAPTCDITSLYSFKLKSN